MNLTFIQDPITIILVLSFVISLAVSLLQRIIFKKNNLKFIRKQIEEIHSQLIKIKEPKEELIKKALELNKILMKENLKILIVSLSLGILGIYFVQHNYSGDFVKFPILGSLNVFYFYILLTFIIGTILSKLLVD